MAKFRRSLPRPSARVAFVALACSSAIALAACGSGGSTSSSGSTGSSESSGASETAASSDGGGVSGKEVVLVSCTDSNPWCAGLNKTLDKELGAEGVGVTTLTSNFEPTQSSEQFMQGLSRQPDLMLYYINDQNAAMPSLIAAQRAGVPVVVLDTALNGEAAELVTSQLLPGHEQLGEFAAESMVEGFEKEGLKSGNVIMLTGTASQYEVTERIDGFKKVMAKYPQYKIVSVQDANWDPIKTGTMAQQLFAKYGKEGIQGAYGMADYQAAAISQAAAQAGIPLYPKDEKGLVVVGSNCAPTGIEAIESGEMYAGATQAPTTEAENDMPYILKALRGEEIEPKIDTMHNHKITKENVKKYAPTCNY